MNNSVVTLRVTSFFLLFFTTYFKDELSQIGVFWVITILILVFNIIIEVLNWKENRKNDNLQEIIKKAHDSKEYGEKLFDESFGANYAEGLEQSINILKGSLELFSKLDNHEFYKVIILNTIGLASEKLAYRGCKFANIYTIENEKLVMVKKSANTDRIVPKVKFHKTEICATEVCNEENWQDARNAYNEIWKIMSKKSIDKANDNITLTIYSSVRSAGYFFLCDYLVYGEKCLGKAKDCLIMYNSLVKKGNQKVRLEDSEQKLKFLKALEKSQLNTRK